MITVQELIDELLKVEDKSKEIIVGVLVDEYYRYTTIDHTKEYEDDITFFLKD